ncbi:GNAT family N-acetyltransferase [Paenarthrobacter sp. NPDC092416]|uniref:GNAT family N-acetyltransferase n=1 Tax=Paenarthrobacter sp. NPDC092416 TaxID=3364386 RepID=UPI0038095EAB
MIRSMTRQDWPAVREIFADGIASGHATFETAVPEWEQFDATRLQDHRLVAEVDGQVLGWTAVSPVSSRAVYSGVVEHSIYVAEAARGQGLGARLLQALAASTEAHGIWTIQSSIFPENEASLRLHQAAGFSIVGRRERIARMSTGPAAGEWRDTLLLERRSAAI